MTPQTNPNPDQDLEQLLAELDAQSLSADLAKLTQSHIFAPPHVDTHILATAADHLQTIQRPASSATSTDAHPIFSWKFSAAISAAAAAAITILVLLSPFSNNISPQIPVANIQPLPEDINEDGSVDILDAFTLARQIRNSTQSLTADLNNDGSVDNADVELITQRAVSLSGGGA